MSARPVSPRDLVLRNLRGGRVQALALALALVAAALALPAVPLTRTGVAVLAVVDITGSMNVRDYTRDSRPESRLETAKAALRALVADLPCGSRLALGLFTERRPFLLFAPIEVCADFAPLDGALAALDWRMAWDGDSRVSAGLFRAVEMAASLDVDLLFVSDGQETPPLPAGRTPPFEGRPGAVHGLIVGVGAYGLSPIPRYDDRGRERGFYGETDVQQENRFGPPPDDAKSRDGYNPRNAPFGASAARGTEHLSSVREAHLKALAAATGLAYAHLDGPSGLATPLLAAGTPRPLPGRLDLAPILAGLALALVLVAGPLGPWSAARAGTAAPARFPPREGMIMRTRFLATALLLAAGTAQAHGPTPQKVDQSVSIRAKPEAVWDLVGPFDGIRDWHPDVAEVAASGGSGPGAQRRVTLKRGGTLVETLDEWRAAERTYSFRMSDPDLAALPVSSYSATISVTPEGEGTKVVWRGRFYRGDTGNEPPDNLGDAAGREAMDRYFADGLKGLKAKLEAGPQR